MNRKKLWKLSVVLFAFAMLTSGTTNAAEVVSGDVLNNTGMGGANLSKVTGARVDTDLTNATITNTKKNSVLEWNGLNTGSNQSLNYIFPDAIGAGQTSLNKVIGTGMSRFAGKLTTEGAGHVIISNPNGMVMYNGAMVNANELTLTTKSVVLDELGNMTLKDNGLKNSITIGNGGTTVIRVAKNLNIVAPIIDINGAELISTGTDKSILGGDIRLITSDGINFFVDTNKFNTNQGIKNVNNTNNLTITNATIAVQDKTNGKIYLTTKGNLNVRNTRLSDVSEMYVGNDLKFENSNILNSKITTVGNANLSNRTELSNSSIYAVKDIVTGDTNVSNSTLTSERNIKISNNSNIDSTKFYAKKGNADFVNSTVKGNSVIKAGVLNLDNTRFENSSAETSYIANVVNNSVLTNSNINAGHNLKISNAKAINSDIKSKQKIYVDTNSVITATHLYANGEIFVSNAKIEGDSQVSTDKDLIISNAILEGNGNLHLYSGNVTRLTDTTARGLYFTGNSVAIYSTRLNDSNLDLKNTLTITNNSELSNVSGINHGELNINGYSRVSNSKLSSTAGLNFGESTIANSELASANSVNGKNTTIDNSKVSSTNGDVSMENVTVINNSKVSAKNVLDFEKSNLTNVSANADAVKIQNSTVNNLNVKAGSDLVIKGGLNNNSVIFSNGTLGLFATEIVNSNISSVGDISVSGTNSLTNGKLFTNGKLIAEGLYTENSWVGAQDTALIKRSKFNNSSVYAKNYLTLKSNIVNNSNLSSVDIEVGNSEVRNSRIDAKRHISFYDNSTIDSVYADYLQSISVTTDSKISNSYLNVGYILLDGIESENVNPNARYDVKYYNTKLLGNYVMATAKQKIIFSNVENATTVNLDGGNLIISNSVLGDAILASSSDGVNIVSTEAKSLGIRGNGDVVVYDSLVNNDLSVSNNSNVALVGNYVGGNSTIDNAKNVIVRSADNENNSTMFDEMTENVSPVTSYDRWKYSDEDFTSKMSENKNSVYMGSLTINNAQSIGIADTVLVGDANFNNVSSGVELINTFVGGNVANNNGWGDYSWYMVYNNARNNGNNGNHYGWDNGNKGNNGNHYGWENGDNGNHYGWGHKGDRYDYDRNNDNVGWDWDNHPRDDYYRWDWSYWGWGRPHDRFSDNDFNGNFLAYWNNFMYRFFR